MVIEAFGALGAIKSASDTVKSLIELRDISLVHTKAIELQRQILAAQEAALNAREREESLITRIRALEEEIAQSKAWDAEADDYELKQIATGAFAYTRQINTSSAEPPHWLCAKCFGQHKKSILQFQTQTGDRRAVYRCPECTSAVITPWDVSPA
jgi:Zn finger protein HypA/HybF involved in hydrogenase expression